MDSVPDGKNKTLKLNIPIVALFYGDNRHGSERC